MESLGKFPDILYSLVFKELRIEAFHSAGPLLTKHNYTKCCPEDRQSAPSSSEDVQGDGERVVDEDIPEQYGAEQEVSHSSDWHDGLPGSSLVRAGQTFRCSLSTPLSTLLSRTSSDAYLWCEGFIHVSHIWLHLGITFLLLRPGAHHDLELGLVQGHQAEVEAREETTEAEEHTEQYDGGPDW